MTMFRQIGPLEITLIVIVLLLLFGAKRLPEIGKSMGKSLREFKSATKGLADDVKGGLNDDDDDEPASKAKDPAKGPAE
jgi:sec-independent protein translocase protein TatA